MSSAQTRHGAFPHPPLERSARTSPGRVPMQNKVCNLEHLETLYIEEIMKSFEEHALQMALRLSGQQLGRSTPGGSHASRLH